MNSAVRMRWRLLELTNREKPWQGLQAQIPSEAKNLFLACTRCELGDGEIDGLRDAVTVSIRLRFR